MRRRFCVPPHFAAIFWPFSMPKSEQNQNIGCRIRRFYRFCRRIKPLINHKLLKTRDATIARSGSNPTLSAIHHCPASVHAAIAP